MQKQAWGVACSWGPAALNGLGVGGGAELAPKAIQSQGTHYCRSITSPSKVGEPFKAKKGVSASAWESGLHESNHEPWK